MSLPAKLADLEPTFVGDYHANLPTSYRQLPGVDGAQGVLFICPKCGSHSVLCWFKNPRNAEPVPDSASPKPGRWTFSGETFDVFTLSPSVDLSVSGVGCGWHGWVQNGVCT